MKVSECMSADVWIVPPEATIQDAARQMLDGDTGALLVGSADNPQGFVTDRDIAVRAVAEGRGPDTPVIQVMTAEVITVCDDQDLDDVAVLMSDRQVRRVAVLGGDGRVAGMISVGDLAKSDDSDTAEAALTGVVQDGGEHQQVPADAA
jgi:CBS domain-containing protein